MQEQNLTILDKVYEPDLDALDIAIVRELIENPATTDLQLAEKLVTSRQTINKRRNSKGVRTKLIDALSLTEKRIRRLAAKALNRLEQALDDPDPKIRLAAAGLLAKPSLKLMLEQPSFSSPLDLREISTTDNRDIWLKDLS